MASHALAKAREIARRSRTRAASEIAKREHSMYSIAAASALGVAEAKGHTLPSVMGLDGKVVAGVAAMLIGENMGGSGGRALQSIADGLLAIAAYQMGRMVGGKPMSGVSGSDVSALEAVLSA